MMSVHNYLHVHWESHMSIHVCKTRIDINYTFKQLMVQACVSETYGW